MVTEVVKTLKASGGDYTTASAWETANQADLTTTDEIRVLECYNDWPSGLSDTVIIDGWTTDSTRYVEIRTPAAERHDGTPGTGFYMAKSAAWKSMISVLESYTRLIGLEVRNTDTGSAKTGYHFNNKAVYVDSCIGNAEDNAFMGMEIGTAGAQKLVNCIGESAADAFEIKKYGAVELYNCIAINSGIGFSKSTGGATAILTNCIAYGCTTSYAGGANISGDTNAADDAATNTPPGTNPITTDVVSGDFVDAANDDFHLASGSAMIGVGTNKTSIFTTDIDGDTRPATGAWDVGIDSFVSAVGALLAAAPAMSLGIASALVTAITLGATASLSASANAALTTAIRMASAPSMSLVAAPSLSTAIEIASAPTMSLTAASSLLTAIELAASPSVSLGANSILSTAIEMAAAADISITAAVDLLTSGSLAAAPAMSLGAASVLTTAIELSAAPALSLDSASILTTAIEMAASGTLSLNALARLTTQIAFAASPALSLSAAAALALVIWGGVYNAVGYFAPGSIVTIALYDPATGSTIALDSSACPENGSTGVFVWDVSKLTVQPGGYQEYAYRMTDGTNFQSGVINMFDAEDSDRLKRLEEFARNERVTDPVTGKQTIMSDAGAPKYRGDIFEDVAETTPYQGDGANVAKRLDDV